MPGRRRKAREVALQFLYQLDLQGEDDPGPHTAEFWSRYPLDEDFLAALEIMPEASGIALGFDRLVMLATGAARIDQVIWAPVVETLP